MQKSTQRLSVVPVTPSGRSARFKERRPRRFFEIPDDELAALQADVVLCRRQRAADWAKERRTLLRALDPGHPNSAEVIGYLAQWSYGRAGMVEELADLLRRFPAAERGRLPMRSYLFLRFAEGILCFSSGKGDSGDLDFVITVASAAGAGRELLPFAHLWKAEMERRAGGIERAIWHAQRSGHLAVQHGFARVAAKAQVLEALLLLDGALPHAVELLRCAEPVLLETEDWLWQGRVEEGFGRAALNEGRYQAAYEHFRRANEFWQRSREPHAELGWAHFNMARAQRLIASRLAHNIDATAERRRRSLRADLADVSRSRSASRQRLEELRNAAFSALDRSSALFRALNDDRALNAVRLELGTLWADCGDLQRAAEHAGECYSGGKRHNDLHLMAHARLFQSSIEKTHCEEGVGVDPAHHAQRAHEYANEALTLAMQCEATPSERRRLLAAIYVSQGLLLLNEFFNNPEAARGCCHSASEHVNPAEPNELWDEYQCLVERALHSGSIDTKLRKWCEGLAEGKTFQQITEEFSDLVIPAVWAREGKNISRVVHKLSISPKKVRRILARAGFKD